MHTMGRNHMDNRRLPLYRQARAKVAASLSQFGAESKSSYTPACFDLCAHWEALGGLEGLCISHVTPPMWTETDVL